MAFCADEVIEVVEGSSVLCGVDDEVALGKQGVEFLREDIVSGAGVGGERHKSTSL